MGLERGKGMQKRSTGRDLNQPPFRGPKPLYVRVLSLHQRNARQSNHWIQQVKHLAFLCMKMINFKLKGSIIKLSAVRQEQG